MLLSSFLTLNTTEIQSAATFTLALANENYTVSKQAGTYTSFAAAWAAMNAHDSDDIVILNSVDKIIAMKKGMVVFITGSTVTFTTKLNGQSVYVTTNSTGYYNRTVDENNVEASISGFTGTLAMTKVLLLPNAWLLPGISKDRFFQDYYSRNASGNLVHTISRYDATNNKTSSASFTVDKAPDFMQSGRRYYSYDGINYYLQPYDVFDPQVQPYGSYYPYFKHLSFRSQTAYSVNELNTYIISVTSSSSILRNQGAALLAAQTNWGVNALMELSFANLESAYGSSSIALNRNNLFGINATDTNPAGANTYLSAADCINQHARYVLNNGYFDAYAYIDATIKKNNPAFYDSGYINSYKGDSRYLGSNPGNKANGVNGKYASDPFHGEKIAGLAYLADKALGSKDYNRYQLGVTIRPAYAYVAPDEKSWKLYQYTTNSTRGGTAAGPSGMSVIILGTVGDFYLIQSEMPLKNGLAYFSWNYDFETAVAYVKKSDIKLINKGGISTVALHEMLEQCNIEDRDFYTPESLLLFDQRKQEATTILANKNKTQAEIDGAATALWEAFQALTQITITVPVQEIKLNVNDLVIEDSLLPFILAVECLPTDATYKRVIFSSSQPTVATVTKNGEIIPLKNGTTTITVTAADGQGAGVSFNLTIAISQIESASYQVDYDGAVVYVVADKLAVNEFLSNLTAGGQKTSLAVYNNNQEVSSGLVKTGYEVRLLADDQTLQTLKIAIYGDLNGDGEVDVADYVVLRNHLLGSKKLSGAYLLAADLNNNQVVDIADYVYLRNMLLR